MGDENKVAVAKGLDNLYLVLCDRRNYLAPDTTLAKAFHKGLKTMKKDDLKVCKEIFKEVDIPTCYFSGFMRWLSALLSDLHRSLDALSGSMFEDYDYMSGDSSNMLTTSESFN